MSIFYNFSAQSKIQYSSIQLAQPLTNIIMHIRIDKSIIVISECRYDISICQTNPEAKIQYQ